MKSRAKPKNQPQTQAQLARALGISRQLINAHAKKPSAPSLDDVEGWLEFLADIGREGSLPPELRAEIAKARLRLLRAQERRLRRQDQIASRELIQRSEVVGTIQRAIAVMFQTLDRLFLSELPVRAQGLDAIAIRKLGREGVEKLKVELRAEFGKL